MLFLLIFCDVSVCCQQIEGTLRILNFNGSLVVKKCAQCKSGNVCTTSSGGYCYSCGDVPRLDEVVRLVGEISHNDVRTEVSLIGDIVDKVLHLPKPLRTLLKEDDVEARIGLSDVLTAGMFYIDAKGKVIAYRPPPPPEAPPCA